MSLYDGFNSRKIWEKRLADTQHQSFVGGLEANFVVAPPVPADRALLVYAASVETDVDKEHILWLEVLSGAALVTPFPVKGLTPVALNRPVVLLPGQVLRGRSKEGPKDGRLVLRITSLLIDPEPAHYLAKEYLP